MLIFLLGFSGLLVDSCMSELNKKDTDVLATQISLDQLQERVQLLSMQNEMLKVIRSFFYLYSHHQFYLSYVFSLTH